MWWFRRGVAILGLLGLCGGCAYAPGMFVGARVDRTEPPGGWFASRQSVAQQSAGNVVDGPSPGVSSAQAPQLALIPITPELIRQQRSQRPVAVAPDVEQLFAESQPYRIGAGDILGITVWDHPELSLSQGTSAEANTTTGGYTVSPQGKIQFPYIGPIDLLGRTEYEVRDLLASKLTKFVKNPQVTVRVLSYRSRRVYIDGEVRTPGLLAINDLPMSLPEAVGRAGGFTASADLSAIEITREGKTTTVSLPLLTESGVNPAKVLLAPGDLVRVPPRSEARVYVLGEVLRPNTLTLRNGRLTLNEALSESGGVSPVSGNPRQVFVIRSANTAQPEIYHLDVSRAAAFALAEGFELRARDVVYVDPVPLVRWNRVISLMLPSAQAITTTRDATDALRQ